MTISKSFKKLDLKIYELSNHDYLVRRFETRISKMLEGLNNDDLKPLMNIN